MVPLDLAASRINGRPVERHQYPILWNPHAARRTPTLEADVARALAPDYSVTTVAYSADSAYAVLQLIALQDGDDPFDLSIADREETEMSPRLAKLLRRLGPICWTSPVQWARDVRAVGRTPEARRADQPASLRAYGWTANHGAAHFQVTRARLEEDDRRPKQAVSWDIACGEEVGAAFTNSKDGLGAAAMHALQDPADPVRRFGAQSLVLSERITKERVQHVERTLTCPKNAEKGLSLPVCPPGDPELPLREPDRRQRSPLLEPLCVASPSACASGAKSYTSTETHIEQLGVPKTVQRHAQPSELGVTFHWTGECRNGLMFVRGVYWFRLAQPAHEEREQVDRQTQVRTLFQRTMANGMFDALTGERLEGEPVPYNVPSVMCPQR
jgi:hypothetical protein